TDSDNNITITDNNITITVPDSKEKFPIIVDYCKIDTELAKTYKNILNNNKDFNNFQFVTAYKNHKNLRRILVRSELEKTSESGAFRGCGKSNCLTCSIHASDADHFVNLHNKTKFPIKDSIYCYSTNLVYLIFCNKC